MKGEVQKTKEEETHACKAIWCKVKMRKPKMEDELRHGEVKINDDIYYCHLGKFL